jgi:hypothetical protein
VLITLLRSHKKIKIKAQHRQINLMRNTLIQRIKITLQYLVNTNTTTPHMPTFKDLKNIQPDNIHIQQHNI